MPDLFGIDIAKLVADNIGPGVLPAVLTKVTPGTRTAGSLTAGTNSTSVDHDCRGFIDDYDASQIDGTLIKMDDHKVTIIGGTLPAGVIPVQNDHVFIEGTTYEIIRVKRDPAAATYTCQARS